MAQSEVMSDHSQNTNVARERLEVVAEKLEAHRKRFESERDSRAVFTYTYELITWEIAAALSQTHFADPKWVVTLDEGFANRFFMAINEANQNGDVPAGWEYVFHVLAHKRTSVLEDMLLGMVAHIVWDLPLAVTDTVPQGSMQSRLADFHLVNDMLGRSINLIQNKVAKRYNPLLGWFDSVAGRQDEILTNYGIRLSRAVAWYHAERLIDPALREETLRAIGASPQIVARELLNPPIFGWRVLLRVVRLLLSLFRRWPDPNSSDEDS